MHNYPARNIAIIPYSSQFGGIFCWFSDTMAEHTEQWGRSWNRVVFSISEPMKTIRALHRESEAAAIGRLLQAYSVPSETRAKITTHAAALIGAVRERDRGAG